MERNRILAIQWRRLICFISILILFGFTVSSARAQYLYVHDDSFLGNRIFGFRVAVDGTVNPVPGSPFATGGFGDTSFDIGSVAAILTVGNRIYSSNVSSNTVSGFSINPDGSLTPIPGSPFALSPGGNPIGVAASSNGQFLFVGRGFTFGPGSGIDVFRIAANGDLTLIPGSPFGIGTDGNGFDVIFDSFRNHVMTNQNSNQVAVFNVAGDGSLSHIPGSPFITPTTNNHKMSLNPAGDLLFIAGGGGGQEAVMNVAASGTLSNAPGSPLFLGGAVIGTTVHPSGRFVYYGLSSFSSNIRGFNVASGGSLTSITGDPFSSGGISPTGLTMNDTGSLLFAVNTSSSNISVLRVGQDGALVPVSGSPFGFSALGSPTGIVFVKLRSFDICLQDDFGNTFQFNSTTGEYQFRSGSGGPTITGIGSVTIHGSVITLQKFSGDHRVLARIDRSVNRGTASIQVFSLGQTFTVMDRNTKNNTCP